MCVLFEMTFSMIVCMSTMHQKYLKMQNTLKTSHNICFRDMLKCIQLCIFVNIRECVGYFCALKRLHYVENT